MYTNKTKFDFKVQRALIKQATNKVQVFFILIGIASVLLVIFSDKGFEYKLFFSMLGILFILLGLFYTKLLLKQATKNNKLLGDQNYSVHIFNEETLEVKSYVNETEERGYTKHMYDELYRIFESPTYFFIYISRVQAYVVDKEGMTEGNTEDLGKFLQTKMKRYKKIK